MEVPAEAARRTRALWVP